MTTIKLQKVHYMPNEFDQGILYMSKEFGIAGHLCACGCGNKVMTPLGPTEWSVKGEEYRPSVRPSIGNGQLPCKSHYIIHNGKILWCNPIDEDITMAHISIADKTRNDYYTKRQSNNKIWNRFKNWLNRLLH
jgi:hypothetical protein